MQLEIAQLDRKYARLRIEDAARLSQLAASLALYGQQSPVVVVPVGEQARYVLIDGYARVAALASLARDVVEALVLELSEPEALVIGHRVDAARRSTALEEGWLLRELCEVHGRSVRELGVQLGRSASWVSRRLALVRSLPESVQRAVQQGRLNAQAAMKYLVPLARANRAQCDRLVEQLAGQPVSVRQMGRLYVAWRGGDAEQRERLTSHPLLFLQAIEPGAEPVERPVEALLGDLHTLACVSARAERRLDERVYEGASERDRPRLDRGFRAAASRFDSLRSRFEEERRDAG